MGVTEPMQCRLALWPGSPPISADAAAAAATAAAEPSLDPSLARFNRGLACGVQGDAVSVL